MAVCVTCRAMAPSTALACPSCGAAFGDRGTSSATQALPPGDFAPTPAPVPSAEAAAGFAPGFVLAGRYRVISLLGRGGMGEVFRADDLKLGLPVALKILSPHLERDSDARDRLHGEVRLARQVSHPHVCRVHDIEEAGGRHFITMEYVDGEDLASLLYRIGRLSAWKAIEIARQVAAGLCAAHERGVVHRDLKPANVMIDGHGRARITDFGLAVRTSEGRGEVAGTPAYMAPEQFRGEAATVKSDIYAFGLLLYELFTGQRPFSGSTFLDWQRLHTGTQPVSPREHVADLDPALERLVLRCLEKDPARRPESVAQVALAMPGGDPLAAAIAAGETPPPEMVAAAGTAGTVRSGQAIAGLVACGLLLLMIAVGRRANLFAWVPLERAPEVLADLAASLAADLGYDSAAPGRAWGFERDERFLTWEADPLPGAQHWRRIETGQPLAYVFWYRQDPAALEPLSLGGGWPRAVHRGDPPLTHAGAVEMALDPRGRLVRFLAVPRLPGKDAADLLPGPENDVWARLFAAAGLEQAAFTVSEPEWIPPQFADRRRAWRGALAEHPDIPIRIEAAELFGKPVWFEVVTPWDSQRSTPPDRLDAPRLAAVLVGAGLALAALAAAVWAARQNLRAGRGDRVGARRLAVAGLLVTGVSQLLYRDLPLTLTGVGGLLLRLARSGLLLAAVLWLAYVALEPYLRRHWPQVLVSWTRLLAGRIGDPMVGRDLFAGVLVGLTAAGAFLVSGWCKIWTHSPFPPNFYLATETLDGIGVACATAIGGLVGSLALVFFMLILLVTARRFLTRDVAAAGALWLLWSLVPILVSIRSWPAVLALLFVNALLIWAITRLGLVAGIAAHWVHWTVITSPVTADFRAPYADTSILVLGTMAALAAYGAWIATTGVRRPSPLDA